MLDKMMKSLAETLGIGPLLPEKMALTPSK